MFSVQMFRLLRPSGVLRSSAHPPASRFEAALSVWTSRRSLMSFRRSLIEHPQKEEQTCSTSAQRCSSTSAQRCSSTSAQRCSSTSAQGCSSPPPSEDGTLIYRGSLARAVRGVKLFSYSTSGTSLLLMPHILLQTGLGASSVALQAVFCGVVGFFTFLTPALLHYVTKGYVVRLYHRADRDTYTAVTYSVLLTEKRRRFHQREVSVPAVSKMFTTFYADKTGLLVNPDLFSVPHDYNHLMGYDKPFTFHLDHKDSGPN